MKRQMETAQFLADRVKMLLKKFEVDSYQGAERRECERRKTVLPVITIPVDSAYRFNDTTIPMAVYNLSPGGMGLISRHEPPCPYLVVDFTLSDAPGLQVMLDIRWARSYEGTYCGLGGRFISGPEDLQERVGAGPHRL